MEKLIEHMIQIVESNAKDNKATIPDVEAWALAWREELAKIEYKQWDDIWLEWSEWVKEDTLNRSIGFSEYIKKYYHPPVKLSNE